VNVQVIPSSGVEKRIKGPDERDITIASSRKRLKKRVKTGYSPGNGDAIEKG